MPLAAGTQLGRYENLAPLVEKELSAALICCREKQRGYPFVFFDSDLIDAARQAGFDVHY
jgi:hypothetical protein